jgi:hypothetical protein
MPTHRDKTISNGQPNGEGVSVPVSDETVERALDRIIEIEAPFFRPAGTLAYPSIAGRVPPAPETA